METSQKLRLLTLKEAAEYLRMHKGSQGSAMMVGSKEAFTGCWNQEKSISLL